MSEPIRKLIGPTKARVMGLLHDATAILQQPLDDDTLDLQETAVHDLSHRLTRCVDILNKCNSDWTTVLKDLEGEAKRTEEGEYDRVFDGDEGVIQVLLNATDVLARLDTRISVIQRRLHSRAHPPAGNLPVPAASPANPLQAPRLSTAPVSLPTISVPTFHEDILKFQEFWDMYESTIHTAELPNVAKFTYSKDHYEVLQPKQ